MKNRRFSSILFLVLILICAVPTLRSQEFDGNLYRQRRQKLIQTMGTGIAVFRNSEAAPRNNDVTYYPFRTNSDFFYLTGFEDPETAFLLIPEGDKKFIMFVEPKNAISAQWFGDVPGVEGAMAVYGADTAFSIRELDEKLPGYLRGKEKVFYDFANEDLRDKFNSIFSDLPGRGPKEIADVAPAIHEMRVVKTETEIADIRKAVDITCDGFLEAMKALEPGMREYEIGSIFSYVFEKEGSPDKAFESIIASGPNATIYHYSRMDRKILVGDLLMMDMGAEWRNYAADVTRVIPANGKFSQTQRDLYSIVLKMQKACVERMKPGLPLSDGMKEAARIAREGLLSLGLIIDKDSRWQYLLYYFPPFIHSLGLDVHDVGADDITYVENGRKLEPGMVFAVEPLLYAGENLVGSFKMQVMRRFSVPEKEVDDFLKAIGPAFEKYKGVAARVEDDVLITPNGNEILSLKLPKTVEDIEKLMAQRSYLNVK